MIKRNENIDWTLAGRILSGEATSEEVNSFEAWLSEKDNRNEWELIEKEIEHVDHALIAEKIDLHQAWINVKEKTTLKKSQHISYLFAAAVASVIIAFVLFFYPNSKKSDNYNLQIVQTQDIYEGLELKDGSTVDINRNSTFLYPDNFSSTERKVTLKGEAFFKVERDITKPFIIETPFMQIKVLGTSFNVKAYTNSSINEVVVNSGTVEVKLIKEMSNKVILQKGDKAIYNSKDNSLIKIKNVNDNYLAWKTKEIEFKNEILSNAITLIEEVYNVTIDIPDNFNTNEAMLTATFDKNTIEYVIEVINQTYGIELKYSVN